VRARVTALWRRGQSPQEAEADQEMEPELREVYL
jgi:hypothetical protein